MLWIVPFVCCSTSAIFACSLCPSSRRFFQFYASSASARCFIFSFSYLPRTSWVLFCLLLPISPSRLRTLLLRRPILILTDQLDDWIQLSVFSILSFSEQSLSHLLASSSHFLPNSSASVLSLLPLYAQLLAIMDFSMLVLPRAAFMCCRLLMFDLLAHAASTHKMHTYFSRASRERTLSLLLLMELRPNINLAFLAVSLFSPSIFSALSCCSFCMWLVVLASASLICWFN